MTDETGSFDERGVLLVSNLILGKAVAAAVVLRVLTAYTGGLHADFQIYVRGAMSPLAMNNIVDDADPDGLRLGFAYGDAEPGMFSPLAGTLTPASPPAWRVTRAGGGGGSNGGRYDIAFDLLPYPSDGSLRIVVAWGKQHMPPMSETISLPSRAEVQQQSTSVYS